MKGRFCFVVMVWTLLPMLGIAADKETTQFLSKTFEVDRIYRSMDGPYETKNIVLLESDEPELLWIKSIRSEMVSADGSTPMSGEFMCHVNMDIDPKYHRNAFKLT